MAQANVELVRSIYEPWGRGDFRWVEWAHPEIEFVLADLGPDGKIRTEAVNLFHVRGAKITRLVLYTNRERGLAELGLSDQDAHAAS